MIKDIYQIKVNPLKPTNNNVLAELTVGFLAKKHTIHYSRVISQPIVPPFTNNPQFHILCSLFRLALGRKKKKKHDQGNHKSKSKSKWTMEFSSRSFRLSRSKRILLSSESVNLECARIGGYERLSQSIRLTGEHDFSDQHKKHKKGMGILSKFLSFTRTSSPHKAAEATAAKKEKKRSSWLPDPDNRWPIQGWWMLFLVCVFWEKRWLNPRHNMNRFCFAIKSQILFIA